LFGMRHGVSRSTPAEAGADRNSFAGGKRWRPRETCPRRWVVPRIAEGSTRGRVVSAISALGRRIDLGDGSQ
jgi:hypothetical protein